MAGADQAPRIVRPIASRCHQFLGGIGGFGGFGNSLFAEDGVSTSSPNALQGHLVDSCLASATVRRLRSAGGSTYLLKPMLIGAVVELIVIPWPYVFGALVKSRGDRWGMRRMRPLVPIR